MGDSAAAHAIEFLSPVQAEEFPDEWYGLAHPRHFWFRWRLAATLSLGREVGLETEAPLRALEVGSGSGVLRDQLEAATRWSIDITDLNLEALRLSGPGRGRRLYYDVCEARHGLVGAYDVVLAFDVLEHVAETARFLRALIAHLRPGGVLLLNVPALPALVSAYDVAAGHHRRYRARSLAAELDGQDARVERVRHWGLSLVPLLALRKLVLGRHRPGDRTIRTGFRPPGALAHAALTALMRAETALWLRPPLGTSLLLAARREGGSGHA
jgi:SAM-dependent methyltransferase